MAARAQSHPRPMKCSALHHRGEQFNDPDMPGVRGCTQAQIYAVTRQSHPPSRCSAGATSLSCVFLVSVIHKTTTSKPKQNHKSEVNGAVRSTETGGLSESQRLLPVTTERGRRGMEWASVDEVKG